MARIHFSLGKQTESCFSIDCRKKFVMNWRRVFAFGSTSIVLAPAVHYWYIFLDSVTAANRGSAILKRLAYDIAIFSPLYITFFYCFQSIFEGACPRECFYKLHRSGPILLVTETIAWVPVQFINFLFVPLAYRVMYDNAVSLCFDIMYSSIYHAEESPLIWKA